MKKNRGITLIALVVTIVVLLILAGVTIAMLTGENGILVRAKEAKEETQKVTEEEQRQLAVLNASMNTEKYDYQADDGKVPIPAGFAPTQIEGENSIKNGLVITDSKGNEFVWIPVTEETKYERNTSYEHKECSQNARNDTNYLPDGINASGAEIEKEIVTKAGGFYVGRYEAGVEGSKLNGTWEGEPTLVCKKGATVYNYITYTDAMRKAKDFINREDVKSTMISGVQWDVLMNFIDGKKDGMGREYKVEEYDLSRHLSEPKASGQNEADKVCNVYDLEGNFVDLVAEKTYEPSKGESEDNLHYVFRGGIWAKPDFPEYNAAYRGGTSGGLNILATFRLVLYVM